MDKKITLTPSKIVGLPKDGKWSQSFSFKNFSCALEIFGPESFETPLLGKQIIEEIQRKYLNNNGKNLEFIKELLGFLKEKANEQTSLNAALCLNNGLILYLGSFNRAKILVKRDERLTAILKGEKEIETASGFLKDNDRIILETESFSKIISEERLNEALNNRRPQEVVDILAPEIQAEENFGGAGIIIEVEIKQEEQEEREKQGKEEKVVITEKTQEKKIEKEEKKGLRAKEAFKRIRNFLKDKLLTFQEKLSLLTSERSIYIQKPQSQDEKKRKVTTTIAFVLILLLIVSILFNIKKKTLSEAEIKFNEAYKIAVKKQEEGKALMDLNPVRSRTLFADAKKTLEEVSSLVSKNKRAKFKLEKLLNEINSDLEIVAKVYRLKELPLFFDLTLIKDKAKGKTVALNNDNLFVYDSSNKSLYKVNIKNKSQEILAGGKELAEGKSLVFLNEKIFLLTDKNVYQIGQDGREKREVIALKKGKEKIIDISSFGTNLYLLDVKNNRIWKYFTTEGGLSSVKNYLTEGINPDFSKAVSMAIDGAIYILRSDGEILKFIQGNPEGFKISGLDINLDKPREIFTNEDLKNIYILDSGNNRVVVINKRGEYQSQYVNEEIGGVEDMVVTRNEKKIYLLLGSKIYEIEIK